jgi:hypothetical protein
VSILEKKENLNWKKLNTIFMTVAFIATAALIVFLLLSKEENSLRSLKEINPDWKPAGDRLKTRWGVNLDPNKVWQEYPRPQLERKDWINLNGLWKYAVKKIIIYILIVMMDIFWFLLLWNHLYQVL